MPRKTKIGTKVAHVTRDSDTTFKIKRSKVKVIRPLCSPPCWRVRRLQQWAWKHVGRGETAATLPSKVNLQGAGAYCGGLPHSLFGKVTLLRCLMITPNSHQSRILVLTVALICRTESNRRFDERLKKNRQA